MVSPKSASRNRTQSGSQPESEQSSRRGKPDRPDARVAEPVAEAALASQAEAGQAQAAPEAGPDQSLRVAELAYTRYLSRGGEDGQDLEDWLEAERQLQIERDRMA